MRLILPLCGLAALWVLPACQTERTVLAGPTVTGLDAQGEKDANSRFGNQDPNGYQQNASQGLNAMSERMFGGKLKSQSEKEFNASRNFLTREFGEKKDFAAKSWKDGRGESSQTWTDQLFDTDGKAQSETAYREAGREAAIKDSPETAKIAHTGSFSGAGRTARTSNYRPAEKALGDGRDQPRLASARPDRQTTEEKAVHDRIANSNASASEINKFLGKP